MRLLSTLHAAMLQREFIMNKEDLDAKKLIRFPLVCGEQISWQN